MASPPYPAGPPPPPYGQNHDFGKQAPYPQDIGFAPPYSNQMIPPPMPTYQAAAMESGDPNNSFASPQFSSKNVRSRFVSRVYLILSVQLLFTFGVCALFCLKQEVKLWMIQNRWASYVAIAVYMVSYMALVCCQRVRRGFPMNFICLSLFTGAFSFMVGTLTAFSNVNAVLMAVGLTVLIVFTICILAACTPIDFTKCYFLLAVSGIVFFFMGIGMMIAYFAFPKYIRIIHLVYCSIGVLLFSLYLAFDTQRILGGKHIEMSEEDYIEGALALYVDIMQIFIYLLSIINSVRNE